MKQLIAAVVLVVACKSSSSTSSQPTPTEPAPVQPAPTEPAPTEPAPTGSAPAPDLPVDQTTPDTPPTRPDPRPSGPPKMGENCGSGDSCGPGLACVSYVGVAGASGPKFKTCEVKCSDPKTTCPSGTKCRTIADGPGQVCRPALGGTPAAKPAMGENCGAGDSCGDGLTCVSYYGIAGARGPQFKTCEVKCDKKGAKCPDGTKCVTVADGPGQVCRRSM